MVRLFQVDIYVVISFLRLHIILQILKLMILRIKQLNFICQMTFFTPSLPFLQLNNNFIINFAQKNFVVLYNIFKPLIKQVFLNKNLSFCALEIYDNRANY